MFSIYHDSAGKELRVESFSKKIDWIEHFVIFTDSKNLSEQGIKLRKKAVSFLFQFLASILLTLMITVIVVGMG